MKTTFFLEGDGSATLTLTPESLPEKHMLAQMDGRRVYFKGDYTYSRPDPSQLNRLIATTKERIDE